MLVPYHGSNNGNGRGFLMVATRHLRGEVLEKSKRSADFKWHVVSFLIEIYEKKRLWPISLHLESTQLSLNTKICWTNYTRRFRRVSAKSSNITFLSNPENEHVFRIAFEWNMSGQSRPSCSCLTLSLCPASIYQIPSVFPWNLTSRYWCCRICCDCLMIAL